MSNLTLHYLTVRMEEFQTRLIDLERSIKNLQNYNADQAHRHQLIVAGMGRIDALELKLQSFTPAGRVRSSANAPLKD